MKKAILVSLAFILAVCACNNKKVSSIDTPQETNTVSDHIPECTGVYIPDGDSTLLHVFQPDTLIMDFDYPAFDLFSSYKINGLKLLIGYYKASDKGEFSPYDSETDYGHRLLCFNSENELIFTSKGAMDTYSFIPHFYRSNDKEQIVVLFQEGTEYYWGADAYLFNGNSVQNIGYLDIEPYSSDEYNPVTITSVTKIRKTNDSFEFTFDADTLLISPGGRDMELVSDAKYIYTAGKLTFEKGKTLSFPR